MELGNAGALVICRRGKSMVRKDSVYRYNLWLQKIKIVFRRNPKAGKREAKETCWNRNTNLNSENISPTIFLYNEQTFSETFFITSAQNTCLKLRFFVQAEMLKILGEGRVVCEACAKCRPIKLISACCCSKADLDFALSSLPWRNWQLLFAIKI